MDRSSEMAVFVRVVEDGGFSSAARSLNLTPSAVSKQITRLEDRLGVRLLNRTTRRLSLTEEGQSFYDRSTRILADIEEAEMAVANLHSAPRGTLRVNCGTAFGKHQISPLVPEFLERYPEVKIEITQVDTLVDLIDEQVDVAIRFGELSDSSLVARYLAGSRRAIVASPEYLEKHGVPKHPSELKDHNCLTFSMTPQLNEWIFKVPEGEYPIRAEGNFSSNSGETIYEMTLAGLGVSRLARFLIERDVRAGNLVMILTDFYRDISVPVHAVYPTRRHLSPKVRSFVDFLVEKFSPVPPWET